MWAIKLCILSLCAISIQSTEWATTPSYFGQLYSTGPSPRGLFLDESGDVLFVGESANAVFALWEVDNDDGTVTVDQTQLLSMSGLNHGLLHHKGFLYASSSTAVYRYQYQAGSRKPITTDPEVVINKIPSGGHTTRTLIFDEEDRLYISIGSGSNVDPNSNRARVRRFEIDNVSFPIDFSTGEVFADGVRNEVGLALDRHGRLWGVENGADELNRPDLGGDIHNGNPAEEMNLFDGQIGTHYGYPYCFSTFNLTGYPAGTQFAWPAFMDQVTDEWCKNESNNRPPALSMPAHTAPLGVEFYNGDGCDTVPGSFPCALTGDAFVALHGSWNAEPKVGYKVIHIPISKSAPYLPTGHINDVIYEPNLGTCGENCLRPVNAVFNKNGHLIISSDATSEIFKVTYGQPPKPISRK